MNKDLGVRERPPRSLAHKAALVMAALAAAAFPVWLVGNRLLKDRAVNVARAEAWAIDGAPCPELTRAEFRARGLSAPKGVFYESATFFRRYGHMACAPVRDRGGAGLRTYAACQFTSPLALKVTTRKGEWYYAPGPGQPATVATPGGLARCVMNSKFRLN